MFIVDCRQSFAEWVLGEWVWTAVCVCLFLFADEIDTWKCVFVYLRVEASDCFLSSVFVHEIKGTYSLSERGNVHGE